MKTKTIKLTDGRELYISELPEGVYNVDIVGTSDNPILSLDHVIYGCNDDGNCYYDAFSLPDGNWQLLGKLPDISEEQASTIVEYFTTDEDFGKEVVFRDYLEKTFHGTALESLDSLLEANGVLFENPLGEKPKQINASIGGLSHKRYEYNKKKLNDWEDAQEKVFDKERTFLFLKD